MACCKTRLIFLVCFLLLPRERDCKYGNHDMRWRDNMAEGNASSTSTETTLSSSTSISTPGTANSDPMSDTNTMEVTDATKTRGSTTPEDETSSSATISTSGMENNDPTEKDFSTTPEEEKSTFSATISASGTEDNDPTENDGSTTPEANCGFNLYCDENKICVTHGDGSFSCACEKGYSNVIGVDGISRCLEIDPCVSNPCLNNGTCEKLQGLAEFRCTCKPGFTGRNCETEEKSTSSATTSTSASEDNDQMENDGSTTPEANCGFNLYCGENEKCVTHGDGSFSCACKKGYSNVTGADGISRCQDCQCGENEECYLDYDGNIKEGNISCRCKQKYVRQDKKCVYCSEECSGPNEVCELGTENQATCVCDTGFVRLGLICIACNETCGENQICAIRQDNQEHYCVCKDGKHKCVKEGLTPSTTSSTSGMENNDPTEKDSSTTLQANCGGLAYCRENEKCVTLDDGTLACVTNDPSVETSTKPQEITDTSSKSSSPDTVRTSKSKFTSISTKGLGTSSIITSVTELTSPETASLTSGTSSSANPNQSTVTEKSTASHKSSASTPEEPSTSTRETTEKSSPDITEYPRSKRFVSTASHDPTTDSSISSDIPKQPTVATNAQVSETSITISQVTVTGEIDSLSTTVEPVDDVKSTTRITGGVTAGHHSGDHHSHDDVIYGSIVGAASVVVVAGILVLASKDEKLKERIRNRLCRKHNVLSNESSSQSSLANSENVMV